MNQIEIKKGEIHAFGIEINSRYGDANEIISMIKCCEEFFRKGISQEIKRISSDGKSCSCLIDTKTENEEKENKIFTIAEKILLSPPFLQ